MAETIVHKFNVGDWCDIPHPGFLGRTLRARVVGADAWMVCVAVATETIMGDDTHGLYWVRRDQVLPAETE